MSNKKIIQITALLGSALLGSCEFNDLDTVPVPSYIHIPRFTVSTASDGSQGDATHQIEDVWVYNDGKLLGTFGLPATIPIQKTGLTKLSFEAGVEKSGQDLERIPYPMIDPYRRDMNLLAERVDTIIPEFKYNPRAKTPLLEDFDNVGFRFTLNPLYTAQGDTFIRVNDATARTPGKNSGRLQLRSGSEVFQMYTTDEYELPNLNQPVFFEMDYKSNLQLVIGYYFSIPNQGTSAPTEVIRLFPTNGEWRKIYLSLNQETGRRPNGTKYKMYIGLFKEPQTEADIMLDNIKLVYFD